MLNQRLSEFQLNNDLRRRLIAKLKECPPNEGALLLASSDDTLAFEALAELNPSFIMQCNYWNET